MFITPFKDEEGYHEAFASFREKDEPTFRLRAVEMINGRFSAVVRYTHDMGAMVAEDRGQFEYGLVDGYSLEDAETNAVQLLAQFLYDQSIELGER